MNDTSTSLIQNFWWFSHVPLRCRLTLQQTAREGRSWSRLASSDQGSTQAQCRSCYPPSQVQIHTLLATSKKPPSFLPAQLAVTKLAKAQELVARRVQPGCGLEPLVPVWSWCNVLCFWRWLPFTQTTDYPDLGITKLTQSEVH